MLDSTEGFVDINKLPSTNEYVKRSRVDVTSGVDRESPDWNSERLENGKWACNHKCKDKKR